MSRPNPTVTTGPRGANRTRRDLAVVLAAVVAGVATWSVWTVAGAELTVDTGSGPRRIGVLTVAVTALLVAAAASGLLRLLETRLSSGRRAWLVVAVAVWVLSLLGPMAATSAETLAALVSLHVVVGVVVVLGLLRPARG
jgi:hypothetical protein